jgi:hypothetical protein
MVAVRDREASYGPPADHWRRTVGFANVILADKLKPGCSVTPEDWGLLMVGDKVARRLGPDGGMDQLVDIAGYADGIGRLGDSRDGRQEGGEGA